MACSLSWRPWPAYRWRGRGAAGPSHYQTSISTHKDMSDVVADAVQRYFLRQGFPTAPGRSEQPHADAQQDGETLIGMRRTARASSSNSEIKFMPRQPMAFLLRDGRRRGESSEFTLPQIERPRSEERRVGK